MTWKSKNCFYMFLQCLFGELKVKTSVVAGPIAVMESFLETPTLALVVMHRWQSFQEELGMLEFGSKKRPSCKIKSKGPGHWDICLFCFSFYQPRLLPATGGVFCLFRAGGPWKTSIHDPSVQIVRMNNFCLCVAWFFLWIRSQKHRIKNKGTRLLQNIWPDLSIAKWHGYTYIHTRCIIHQAQSVTLKLFRFAQNSQPWAQVVSKN